MGQWYAHQETRAEGSDVVIVDRQGAEERHAFGTSEEAAVRARVIAASLSWIGTPFQDCGFIKGPEGAVDCAMKLVGTYGVQGAAIIGDFDPRPYPPRWFQHRSEERFLDILQQLGAREVPEARPGDIMVWRFGRTYAHGAVRINSREVCHAYAADRQVTVTAIDQPLLSTITWRGQDLPRPVRCFSHWAQA